MAPLVAFRDLKALLLTLVVARCEWLATADGIFPPSPPALNLNGREDARLSEIVKIPKNMRKSEFWVLSSENGKGPRFLNSVTGECRDRPPAPR